MSKNNFFAKLTKHIAVICMRVTVLIFSLFCFACCDKDKDKFKTELEKLPPATQEGKNKAGCLVNGKAFLPGKGSWRPLGCYYKDQKDFSLKISKKEGEKLISLILRSYDTRLIVGETYQLLQNSANSKYGEYIIYNEDFTRNHYLTTTEVIGEFTITHHDFNNVILSGTFWFDAVNSNGEKVEVREGRFDVRY